MPPPALFRTQSERAPQPEARSADVYQELFALYRRLYFGMGRQDTEAVGIGEVLPALRRIAASVREVRA